MKKLMAGIAVAFLVTLMSLGFATNAHADYGDELGGGDNLPSGVEESGTAGSGAEAGSGVLPATGGPQTVLLVGGAALVAAGGVALVATRRQSRTDS